MFLKTFIHLCSVIVACGDKRLGSNRPRDNSASNYYDVTRVHLALFCTNYLQSAIIRIVRRA